MNISLTDDRLFTGELVSWPIAVERVLYEAEEPIVYVTRSRSGQPLLAYVASHTPDASYIVLAPASPSKIRALESGEYSVRSAFVSDWTWLVRGAVDGQVQVWNVEESDIPDGYLPLPGTPLLPEHTVVFSAKATGDGLVVGHMPSSVVSLVADSARKALKPLLDHMLSANSGGRPTDAQRALYDLPVRQLKFGSFEIGLAEPAQADMEDQTLAKAIAKLESGLAWASSADESVADLGATDEEREALLRATLALTPPTSGVVTAIDVGGAWLHGRQYHLDRKARKKVWKSLRNLGEEKIFITAGRIGEIDDDNLSFTLRETPAGKDYRATFDESLLEDMRTLYYEGNKVQVSGIEMSGRLRVTAAVSIGEEVSEDNKPSPG